MSDDFSAVLDAAKETGAGIADFPSSSPTATATPAAAPAESPAQTPTSGSAGSAVPVPDAAAALPSQSAAPIVSADPIADARKVLEASPEFKPIFELQQRFNGGDLAETLPYLEMLARDQPGFYKALGDHLRQTGQLEADKAPAPFKLPEADLRAEDGTTAYSASKLGEVIEALRAEFTNQLQTSVKPLDGIRQEREAQQAFEQRRDQAKADIARAQKHIPDFAELEPEIKKIIQADYQKPVDQRDFNGNIYAAAHVARTNLKPSLEQSAKDKITAGLKEKAAASTEGPGTLKPTNVNTTAPNGFMDAFERDPQNAEAAINRIFGR